MSVVRISTKDGSSVEIEMAAVERFGKCLRGPVLLPESVGYEDARRIWNGMIDRRPAIIARCLGTADVASAVKFASEHDVLVAVKNDQRNLCSVWGNPRG